MSDMDPFSPTQREEMMASVSLRQALFDLRAQLSRQSAELEALREALLAKMQLEGRGGNPRKLDEALAWIQNDEKAERLAQEALALRQPISVTQSESAKKCGHGPEMLKVVDLYCAQCVEEAK